MDEDQNNQPINPAPGEFLYEKQGLSKIRRWMIKYVICSIFLLSVIFGGLSSSIAQIPKEWSNFTSVERKAVIVKSDISGGNLERVAILKGKVRNITNTAIREIYVAWLIYDEKGDLIPTGKPLHQGYSYNPSLFVDKIDYLDAKVTEDFEITLDLFGGVLSELATKMRKALHEGRFKVELYLKRK
jgi:hypothetical protein